MKCHTSSVTISRCSCLTSSKRPYKRSSPCRLSIAFLYQPHSGIPSFSTFEWDACLFNHSILFQVWLQSSSLVMLCQKNKHHCQWVHTMNIGLWSERKATCLLRVALNKLTNYDWTKMSTLQVVMKAFWKESLCVGLLLFPCAVFRLAIPFFLRQIVLHVSGDDDRSSKIIYLFAIGIGIFASVQAFIYQQLVSAKIDIFQEVNHAHILNLVANDATKFQDFLAFGTFCGVHRWNVSSCLFFCLKLLVSSRQWWVL